MSDQFTAELLEAGARGIASRAATTLLEARPELVKRFEPFAFSRWQQHLTQVVLELAAAVRAGEPALFRKQAAWSRIGMETRGVRTEDLRGALEALKGSLGEALPKDSVGLVVPYVTEALDDLDAAPDGSEQPLDPSNDSGLLAAKFMATVLEGDRRAAIRLVLEAADAGVPLEQIYSDVLIAGQREMGRMWHTGETSIAEEHFVTDTAKAAMAALSLREPAAAPNGKTVLIASVEGNVHDIAVTALADLMEHRGWRAICIGSDLPAEEVSQALRAFEVDLLALSATLTTQIEATRASIGLIRDLGVAPPILVGGRVFDTTPELWRKVGADAYAPSVADADKVGRRLVGLD